MGWRVCGTFSESVFELLFRRGGVRGFLVINHPWVGKMKLVFTLVIGGSN